jgi:hypothetical protein
MITDMGGKDLFSIKKSRGKIFKYVKDKKYLIFSYALLLRKKKLQMVQNKTTSFTNIKFSASYLILKLRWKKQISFWAWLVEASPLKKLLHLKTTLPYTTSKHLQHNYLPGTAVTNQSCLSNL